MEDNSWVVFFYNDVVDYATRAKKECFLFKVDFEKACNKMSWDFLKYMLNSIGFGRTWMK